MDRENKKIRIDRIVKKSVLILILAAMCIVVGVNYRQFYVDKDYTASNTMNKDENGVRREPEEIPLDGSVEVRQIFKAKEPALQKIKLDFKAWEQMNGSGLIRVEIEDETGEILASAEKKVQNLVQNKQSVTTTFSVPAALKKGEMYTLVVRSVDVKNDKGVYLYGLDKKGSLFSDLTVDGNAHEGRIKMSFTMTHFAKKSLMMIYGVLIACMIFVLIPFGRFRFKVPGHEDRTIDVNKWLARILFVASVPASFFIVQRYSGYGIGDFIRLSFKLKGILNYFLIGLLWWILYLITNRTKYTAVLLAALCSFVGLANYFVWNFRGIPIMVADLASIGTAMDVAENYSYELNMDALWALSATVGFLCAVLSLDSYKGLRRKGRLAVLLLFSLPFGIFYTQLLHGDFIKRHGIQVSVWEPARNYAKNGSLLSLFISYTYYVVDKPEGYSAAKVESAAEEYVSDSAAEDTGEVKPNLIVIMDEAFADLDVNADLETSEDFMPYIHSLEEDVAKGDLYVSVFAGNTANSEFEFLTGCSMAFLPFRSIPYDTYIKDTFPSLTHNLVNDGYAGNYAVHPATKTAWSRDTAYPAFGFEEFFVKSDFTDPVYIRNFVSDRSDFEFLISKYEETRETSDEPFYIFNVTMQNHGGYSVSQGFVETPIEITNEGQYAEDAQQYINLIRSTDDAFRELTAYFEKVDEPTVILMFGDHQPSLSTEFYESLFGKKTDDYTLEDTKKKYTVPYIIWANYDIEEARDNMSANYLAAYLMKLTGGKMSGYQKYLMDLYEKVPMITANAYCGSDGVLHELDEKSEYSDDILEYQIIQYNNMFDTKNRVESFFGLAG